MGNTLSNMNQRNPSEPVPPLPLSSSDLSRLHLARPRPQSSAASIYRPPPPAIICSHPHQVVAIIVWIVRIGIGRDDPERDEVAEVATVEGVMVEASRRASNIQDPHSL